MVMGIKVPTKYKKVWIDELESNTYRMYRSGDIDVFLLLIVGDPANGGYKP